MYTEQMTHAVHIKNDRGEGRFDHWTPCPGYVIRTNAAGFQWKQVCACCPHPPSPYVQVSYNFKM
jgi:hypothetical protein